MDGKALLHLVDAMHREKNIPREVIFEGIESALQLAAERDLKSIAFPAISTGVYGYPMDEAAEMVVALAAGRPVGVSA